MSYLRSRHAHRAALGDIAVAPMSQEEWNAQMLATTQQQFAYIQQQVQRDRNQKWIGIAATASIPLFGMIWKMILGRRRARMSL